MMTSSSSEIGGPRGKLNLVSDSAALRCAPLSVSVGPAKNHVGQYERALQC